MICGDLVNFVNHKSNLQLTYILFKNYFSSKPKLFIESKTQSDHQIKCMSPLITYLYNICLYTKIGVVTLITFGVTIVNSNVALVILVGQLQAYIYIK